MKILAALATLVACSSLWGCAPEPRSVDYYVEHPGERSEQLDICKREGEKHDSPSNCKNAQEAEAKGPAPK